MKKTLILCMIALLAALTLAGCSKKDEFDSVRRFDRAILRLPDGTIVEGKVQSWTDFEDGDQLQVKINGKTYLIHSSNCVLIVD